MPEIAALQAKIAQLEAKTFEQERTIRHTLTMLIEWIEGEMDEARAA
jgi:general secretion pathway protein A